MKILFSFLFIINATYASTCSTVDLTAQAGPIRNQDGLGWCTAYAFADALSMELGKRVSAQDLSLNSIVDDMAVKIKAIDTLRLNCDFLKGMDGPYQDCLKSNKELDEQIKEITSNKDYRNDIKQNDSLLRGTKMRNGVCLESDFPSYAYRGEGDTLKDLINKKDLQITETYSLASKAITENKCEEAADLLAPYVPGKNLTDIIKAIEKSSEKKLAFDIQKVACQKRYFNKELQNLEMEYRVDYPESKTFLDETLSKNKSPILAFKVNSLLPGYAQVQNDFHAVLVVARKPGENGQCMYKIKNSWGPECHFFVEKYQTQCEKGYIWLSEEDIQKSHLWTSSLRNIQ